MDDGGDANLFAETNEETATFVDGEGFVEGEVAGGEWEEGEEEEEEEGEEEDEGSEGQELEVEVEEVEAKISKPALRGSKESIAIEGDFVAKKMHSDLHVDKRGSSVERKSLISCMDIFRVMFWIRCGCSLRH